MSILHRVTQQLGIKGVALAATAAPLPGILWSAEGLLCDAGAATAPWCAHLSLIPLCANAAGELISLPPRHGKNAAGPPARTSHGARPPSVPPRAAPPSSSSPPARPPSPRRPRSRTPRCAPPRLRSSPPWGTVWVTCTSTRRRFSTLGGYPAPTPCSRCVRGGLWAVLIRHHALRRRFVLSVSIRPPLAMERARGCGLLASESRARPHRECKPQAGGTHVFLPKFAAADAVRAIRRHGVTALIAVPAMLADMTAMSVGAPCPSVRRLLLGGGCGAKCGAPLVTVFEILPPLRSPALTRGS